MTAAPLPVVDIEPIAWTLEAAWTGERPVSMSPRRRRFGRGTMCRGPRTPGGVDSDRSGSPRAPTETQSPRSHHAFPRIARRDVVPRAGHGADGHAQGPRQSSRGRGAWGTVNSLGSGFFQARSCASNRVTCFRDRDLIRGRGLCGGVVRRGEHWTRRRSLPLSSPCLENAARARTIGLTCMSILQLPLTTRATWKSLLMTSSAASWSVALV